MDMLTTLKTPLCLGGKVNVEINDLSNPSPAFIL